MAESVRPVGSSEGQKDVPGIVIDLMTDDKMREALIHLLERNGLNETAHRMRNPNVKYEKNWSTRAKGLWNYSPTVGDVVVVAAWVAGAVVVYELGAWGLRRVFDVNIPSLLGPKRVEMAKVTQIRKVAVA